MTSKVPSNLMPTLKRVKFRAKVSEMGDKVIIIIPKSYHKDIQSFKNKFVDVEVAET
jgi:hypothetical protein